MGVILGDKLEAIPFAADYAQAMGRAFQIVDDILDVTGTLRSLASLSAVTTNSIKTHMYPSLDLTNQNR